MNNLETSGLIKRYCPLCHADDFTTMISMKQGQFTLNNPAYRLDRIHELSLPSDQLYPIVACKSCGMVYTLYHLTDEKEALLYDRIIDPDYSKSKVTTLKRKISDNKTWLLLLHLLSNDKANLSGAIKILDYGCGWGTLLQVAAGTRDVVAIGLDVASYKVQAAQNNGVTVLGTEEQLYPLAPFDLAVSTSVLEHLRNPIEAVQTMAKLLRPKGFALITCIIKDIDHLSKWKGIKHKLDHGAPITKNISPWEHLNYFTNETFNLMLNNAGFIPVKSPGLWVDSSNAIIAATKKMAANYLSEVAPSRMISSCWQKL